MKKISFNYKQLVWTCVKKYENNKYEKKYI